LLRERINKLRKNLVRDDSLSEFIRVVGKTAECEGS
jgi:hypothetical protein